MNEREDSLGLVELLECLDLTVLRQVIKAQPWESITEMRRVFGEVGGTPTASGSTHKLPGSCSCVILGLEGMRSSQRSDRA